MYERARALEEQEVIEATSLRFAQDDGLDWEISEKYKKGRLRVPSFCFVSVENYFVSGSVQGFTSRAQMLRKLMGSLLSPCACSLMGAVSYAL